MKAIIRNYLLVALVSLCTLNCKSQNPPNWTDKELMQPAQLATSINSKKDNILIICVGPSAVIPQSVSIGMAGEQNGVDKLKKQLTSVKKDKEIVIYCGCCPFDHCPNVRPAIDVLRQMKFTNFHLLNLPDNIRKDWIDKGYPVDKS